MATAEVMSERAMLIGWKHSHGLTADEAARLDWLNAEALRLCPLVTRAMTAAVEAIRARLDAMQARRIDRAAWLAERRPLGAQILRDALNEMPGAPSDAVQKKD